MIALLRGIVPVFIGIVLLELGHGLITTLVGVRMTVEQFPVSLIGVVGAAFYTGGAIGCVAAGRLIRLVGHIRAFAGFAGLFACATLMMALIVTPAAWIVLRGLSGFCLLGLVMVAESWLNALAVAEQRSRVLALYMIALYASIGAGQFFLNLAPAKSFELFAIGAMFFAGALVPLAFMRSTSPQVPEAHPALREIFSLSPLALVGCFASGLISGGFYTMAPVFAEMQGYEPGDIALFIATPMAGTLILQWPIGWLSDRRGRRGVLVLTTGVLALAALAIAQDRLLSPLGVLGAALAFGGMAFVIYPLSLAHATDWSGPRRALEISQGLLIAYSVGAALAPLLGAEAINLVGPEGLFYWFALVAALLAAFTVVRMIQRAPVPVEQQEHFVPVPQTTPVVAELDPRTPGPAS